MNQWLRKIWCCLTGGHRYEDKNLESYHCPKEGITFFRNICVKCGKSYVSWVRDKELFPAVDAVEVVRCKGCKHWNELKGKDSGKPVGYGDCRNGCGINGIAYEDSFCSYGERRTDG